MKVTVITTVYNRVEGLAETMKSVLYFARPGFDYIVIDGGSTDGSVDVIREQAYRLKHWMSEPDEGIYHAMNKGWALADPDSRLIFVGAGDRLISLPELGEPDIDSDEILYGDVELDSGRVFYAHTGIRLRLYNSIHHQAILIPKRLHFEPPFDLNYPHYADFDFNQRLFLKGAKFRYDPGFRSYAAPGGVTSEMQLDELRTIIHKNFGSFWSLLSLVGFSIVRVVPFLKVFRPIH